MTTPLMEDDLRAKIIANPTVLLEDPDVMRALVGANDDRQGNVVDLRAVAMDRLTARFDRLEDTHRNVIAAAYDNLAGTNQVHRAILRMMDAETFDAFLTDLAGDVSDILRIDAIRLVLETETPEADGDMGPVVTLAPVGFVDNYVTLGRNMPARQITLRAYDHAGANLFGDHASHIKSEGCLRLDLGDGNLPGMLVMGCEHPDQFSPQQGTDLLTFFAGVLERVMRRWLV